MANPTSELQTPNSELKSLLTAARAAEARFDHETAEAHFTAALELPEQTAEERFEILEGRAKTYRHWQNVPPFAADVEALIALAREMGDKERLAETLAVYGYFLMNTGPGTPSEAFLREAVALAEEIGSERLLAYTKMTLGQRLYENGDPQTSWQVGDEALEHARRSGDAPVLFYMLQSLVPALAIFNRIEEAQQLAAEMRALAAESGSLYKQWRALNGSGIVELDLARKRTYFEGALDITRMVNSITGQVTIANNIGLLFYDLGLYGRALAYLSEVVERAKAFDRPAMMANFLESLGRIYLERGQLEEAERAFQEGVTLEYSFLPMKALHMLGLGWVALARGEWPDALERFEEAATNDPNSAPTARAGMAAACLALEEAEKALEQTSRAVEALGEDQLISEFPTQEIWLRHYQALDAVGRDNAFDALAQAQSRMLDRIETLSDEGLRRNFLNKVAVNRDITLTWAVEAARRGIPLDRLTAHQPLPGKLREQFRRVVEIGGRFTAQHEPHRLADFIVEEFVEMSGAERVLLLLLDEEDELRTAASFNPGDALELAEPLLAGMRRSRQPLLIRDVETQNLASLQETGAPPELHQRSLIALPLIAQGRMMGVLYGDMRQIFGRFDRNDLNLLGMLANQAAAALENADLVSNLEEKVAARTADLEQRNSELAIINNVQAGLASELDLQTIAEIVGETLREIFPGNGVSLALYDWINDRFSLPYVFEEGKRFDSVSASAGGHISRYLIHSLKPLYFANQDEYEAFGYSLVPGTTLAKSGLYIPMVVGERLSGYISLESHDTENAYDDADLRLLTTLANSMSVALENARLFDEAQRRAREMASLAEVGRDISATLDQTAVLQRIAAHALDLLDVSDSALFLPDETGKDMRSFIALGEIAEQLQASIVQPGVGILGDVWQKRLPEIINDASSDPRSVTIAGTTTEPDERLMVAPLLSGEEVVGLLAVWRSGDPFSQQDLDFLDGLARQAAIAIQNAQLYSDAETAEALANEANEAKSAFMSSMSHELRTPLNAIIGFTRIVKRKTKDDIPEKQNENLGKVLSSAEHLLGLINTILDIAKIESGRMDVVNSKVEVKPLVESVAMTAQPLVRPGVELQTEITADLPALVSDQDKVKQILLNLLSNAAKFTHEGSITIRAQTRALREAPLLEIQVVDTGIGISEEALGRIFEEFQQADEMTQRNYGGTGLGLSISQHLAGLLGGDLTAASVEGEGSTFTLAIPFE